MCRGHVWKWWHMVFRSIGLEPLVSILPWSLELTTRKSTKGVDILIDLEILTNLSLLSECFIVLCSSNSSHLLQTFVMTMERWPKAWQMALAIGLNATSSTVLDWSLRFCCWEGSAQIHLCTITEGQWQILPLFLTASFTNLQWYWVHYIIIAVFFAHRRLRSGLFKLDTWSWPLR